MEDKSKVQEKKTTEESADKKQRGGNKKQSKIEQGAPNPQKTKEKAPETKEVKEKKVPKLEKMDSTRNPQDLLSSRISILSNLIKYEPILSKKLKNDNYIHYSLIELCLKFDNGLIRGSNRRCLAFFECMKKIIESYKLPPNAKFNRDLEKKIEMTVEFIKKYGIFDEGIFTFIKTLKYFLRNIPDDSLEDNKNSLLAYIEQFKEDKILKANMKIIEIAKDIIQNKDIVMTFGYSSMISKLLIAEFKSGKTFQVIAVDNYPFNEGRIMNEKLLKNGVPCIYTLLNSVPKFMPKINKIIVGASSLLINGFCLSRVGTAMLACLAHNYMKPFIVLCETYKLSERSQLDPFSLNEFADPNKIIGKQKAHPDVVTVNMRWDLTPRKFISMIVTELGKFPASSVPVLLQELGKINYDIDMVKK